MEVIWQALAAWLWLIILLTAGGIAALGGFVDSRVRAKDKLKLELAKRDAAVASTNLQIQLSQERQSAMDLRALQISHDLPTHYIGVLDDPQPKKKELKK